MLTLFTKKLPPINQGITISPYFDYVKNYYTKVTNDIFLYRKIRDMFVPNENILVRLLKLNSIPYNTTDIGYYKYIDGNAYAYARELEMTSVYNKGKFHFNNLYTGSREVYIITKNVIPIGELIKDWELLEPIRVLYTDNDTLDLTVPDKLRKKNVTLVMEIDIFKLYFQYKYWCIYRMMNNRSTDPTYYIGSYVYPKISASYLDYSLWNIYCNMFYNRTCDIKFNNDLPFSISNYSEKIRYVYNEQLNKFTNNKNSLERVLNNIPLVKEHDAFDLLNISRYRNTKQSIWWAYLFRVPELVTLLDMIGEQGIIANKEYVNGIERSLREFANFGTVLPNNTPKDIERDFNYSLGLLRYKI